VLVELRSVNRSRGDGRARRLVIQDLSLRFAPGQLTAVLGRSGTGKTTLLRLLAALDTADSGELLIGGQPTNGYDGEQLAMLRRERIGYLPQEPSPVGFLSAAENVALVLRVRGYSAAADAAEVAKLLAGAAAQDRQTVICATHDPELVRYADIVVELWAASSYAR
jgi:putative ABC transport system ATP-binding protein